MMHISERGIALLKQFEGFSAAAYLCPAGKRTIGYGHVMHEGDDVAAISEIAAENLLKQDISVVEAGVSRVVGCGLTQGQFDAVVCLAYNIGVYAFEKSTLCRFVTQGEMELAAEQFGRWVFAGNVKLPGLVQRREAEKHFFYPVSIIFFE